MLLFVVVFLYVAVCCCLFICCCLLLSLYMLLSVIVSLYLLLSVVVSLYLLLSVVVSLYLLLFVVVSLYVAVCSIYLSPKITNDKMPLCPCLFLVPQSRPSSRFPMARLCYYSVIYLRVRKSTTFSPYLQIFAAILDFFYTFVLLFPVFLDIFLFLSHPSFLHSPVSFSPSPPYRYNGISSSRHPEKILPLRILPSPSLHLPRVVITTSRHHDITEKSFLSASPRHPCPLS